MKSIGGLLPVKKTKDGGLGLSITFYFQQLTSLQTGHPFYAATNFCQYQSTKMRWMEKRCGGQ